MARVTAEAAGRPRERAQPARRRWREELTNLLFVLPLLAVLGGFLVYPLISGLLISLYRSDGMTRGEFVGLDNYVEAIFRDAIFHQALGNTILFTLAAIVLQTGLGLLLAVLISELRAGRLPYRLVFFAPVVVSTVAVGFVWKWLYAPFFGLVTLALARLGLMEATSSLLSSQATALGAIMAAFLWRWAGFNTVIYLAGMQSISAEYHEAATVDGANALQRFRHVTWPLLLPQTVTCVVLTTMGTLRIFDLMWVMTQGGPGNATETVATYIYVTAFRFFRVGYAQAIAFILFALILVLSLIELRVLRRYAEEHGA